MNTTASHGDQVPNELVAPSIGSLQLIALLLVYAATWLLLTPYAGLSHDAQAYAFQSLARLDPTVLGQDVFLKYDSQDRYTVFPWVYASLIRAFGVETTAFCLTLTCHALWYAMAFLICRRLFGTPLALLCLGLLIAIPGWYGGLKVFRFAEPFLAARLPAEVISLAAILTWLRGMRLVAAGLLVVAGLVHPLMTFPTVLLLSMLWIGEARPRGLTMPWAASVVVVGAIVGSLVLGLGSAVMSDEWVEAIRTRSDFLFVGSWEAADWNGVLLGLLTLVTAALALGPGQGRTLAKATFWVALAGLVLAVIASEMWNLEVLMQGQPWRWLWLGRFMAIAILPATLHAAWVSGAAGRATALLLGAAWLAVEPVSSRALAPTFMGTLLAAAGVSIWLARARTPVSTQVVLTRGATAVFALVLVAAAVTTSLGVLVQRPDQEVSRATQGLLMAMSLVTPAIAIVGGAWAALHHIRHSAAVVVVIALGCGLMALAVPFTIGRWADTTFIDAYYDDFADWRERIPRDTEVFWWDGLREVWFLLDRRSYLTQSQGGGVVFSGEVSAELRRRAENTSAFIDPGYWFNEPRSRTAQPRQLTKGILAQTCSDPILGFVVSGYDLGTGAARKEWPDPGRYIYLYDCNDFREGSTS